MFIHAKMRKGSNLSFVVFFAFRTVYIFIFVYKIKNNNQSRSRSTKRFISHIWMNDADQKDNEGLMIRSSSSENAIPPKDVLFYILPDKNYHIFLIIFICFISAAILMSTSECLAWEACKLFENWTKQRWRLFITCCKTIHWNCQPLQHGNFTPLIIDLTRLFWFDCILYSPSQ